MGTSLKPNVTAWLLWYISTAAFIFILPSFKFGTAFWEQQPEQTVPQLLLTGAHLLAGIILATNVVAQRKIRFIDVIVLSMGIFAIILLWLFQTRSSFSRMVLPLTMGLSITLQVTGLWILTKTPRRIHFRTNIAAATMVALTYIVAITNLGGILENTRGITKQASTKLLSGLSSGPETVIVESVFYKLDAVFYTNYIEAARRKGGGLTQLGDELLLATGEGDLYLLDQNSEPGDIKVTKLSIKVPSNYETFYNEAPPEGRELHFWFRVADVYAKTDGQEVQIFSTYHHWKSNTGTIVVRLARLTGTREQLLSDSLDPSWEVLFESTPDIEIKRNQQEKGYAFVGLQVGGRIQELDNQTLLFSIGDHEYDGWNYKEKHPQDHNTSYGKTIQLNLQTLKSEIFSMGHRNPQGLYINSDGIIYSTEHGPQGGGELNLIKKGKNYGWPEVTFGTEYGRRTWPLNKTQGDHIGYEYPIYAWATSLGVSALIGLEKDLFPIWEGDLMVSSLMASSLFRIKMRHGRAVTMETIEVGENIRDLIEDSKGRIVLWTDKSQIVVIQPSLQKDIEIPSSFVSCAACHTANKGAPNGIGPNLNGIFERDIAETREFNYSPSLQQIQGAWTDNKMNKFLENPQKFAPGTTMLFPGIPNPEQRKKIIEYLKSL